MVEKVVRTVWVCGLCAAEFKTKAAAVACEAGRAAEPSFEVDDLFTLNHILSTVFVGWYRNDKTPPLLEEIPIYRLVGAALARTTGHNIATLSHRLLYILEDDSGSLHEESLVRLKTDFTLVTDENKPELAGEMLRSFGRFPDLPELAEQIADQLLKKAKSLLV